MKFWCVCVLMAMGCVHATASTVTWVLMEGPGSQQVRGGGSILDVFEAAATMWDNAIPGMDPLTIELGWSTRPLDSAAAHIMIDNTGPYARETRGRIVVNAFEVFPWFLDPTPNEAEEYLSPFQNEQDFGGGPMVVGRGFMGAVGNAAGSLDLLSVALHELGHARGPSMSNGATQVTMRDGHVVLTQGSWAGAMLPVVNGAHFDPEAMAYGAVMSGINTDERRLLSDADIEMVREISGYRNILADVPEAPVPEPSTFACGVAALIVAILSRKFVPNNT